MLSIAGEPDIAVAAENIAELRVADTAVPADTEIALVADTAVPYSVLYFTLELFFHCFLILR